MGASRVIYIDGPQKGYAANFLHSLRHAKIVKILDVCDHDDIWKNTKLEYAKCHNKKSRSKIGQSFVVLRPT